MPVNPGDTLMVMPPGGESPIEMSVFAQVGRARAFQTCNATGDCSAGLTCEAVLGVKVCTTVGCASGAACPDQAFCLKTHLTRLACVLPSGGTHLLGKLSRFAELQFTA